MPFTTKTLTWAHGAAAAACCATGNTQRKIAPRPALLSAHIRPPWARTIDLLMESPIPKPARLVLKNGSNS
jgi:hypothetical protein